MISKEDALQQVLKTTTSFGKEEVSLHDALGRVLAEEVKTDRDLPPFNRVAMDGIAINFDGVESSNDPIIIEDIAPAGAPQKSLNTKTNCIEVMTGAVLPENTDTVIRYEDLTIQDRIVTINTEYKKGQNVHTQAKDRSQGQVVIHKNTLITPAEVGVAASVGATTLVVKRNPKVCIISTGDELVSIDQQPLPHQIRSSNVEQIHATLVELKIDADKAHISDDYEGTEKVLGQKLREYDVLVLSGGVSKGKFDYVPKALDALGVNKHFHRVAQKPGKPFWFGTYDNKVTIFALPGNPVSSFMCTRVYVMSWIRKTLGLDPIKSYATLKSDYSFKPNLTYFLQVKLSFSEDGLLQAEPRVGHGSGDFANLIETDAFLELPPEIELHRKGSSYPVHIFKTHSF